MSLAPGRSRCPGRCGALTPVECLLVRQPAPLQGQPGYSVNADAEETASAVSQPPPPKPRDRKPFTRLNSQNWA